jgi:hypothetical protein
MAPTGFAWLDLGQGNATVADVAQTDMCESLGFRRGRRQERVSALLSSLRAPARVRAGSTSRSG